MLECLDAYQLLREDMDNVMDLTTWQGRPAPMKAIDAKVSSSKFRSMLWKWKIPSKLTLLGGSVLSGEVCIDEEL